MSLQNSLWLDPIQGRQCVPDLDCKSGLILKDFRQLMLNEKLAVNNPEHLTKLYAICKESGISIPDYTTKPGSTKGRNDPSKHLPDPQWAFIPDEDFQEVFFTSAHNPREFFVCICKFVSNMKKLTNEIQKYVAEYKPIEDDLIIHTGVVCLGRFPDDGLWYRAQVLSVTDEGRVELFFVDHGDSAFVDATTDIIPIQPKLIITLPFQAIECSLAGIEAIGGGSWSEEATDELYELTVNLKTDYRKPMYLTACSKEKASCTDGHKYNILLACKDDDEKNVVVVNEVFLKSEFAQVSENGIESDALKQLRKNLEEFRVLSEAKDDGLLGDNDPESHPEPICKQSNVSSDATGCEDIESKSGTIVPASKPNSWIADEVHNGFGDFDFEFGDSEDTNPAETFIRDFLNLGPKEDSSRGECASNQCLPPKQRNVSVVEVPNTDSCLPIVCQNVVSATTADIQESPGTMSKTPNVIWYQDQIYVTMSVEIPNIDDKHYHLQVGKSTVAFTTEVDEETYSFNLQLYGTVNLCEHASTGRTIRIKIKKIVPGNWPRLQKQRKNFWWLRYNIDYEDNTGEDYVRINPIGQLPIAHQNRDVRMDLQEEESEDSDFEEDEREFEPRDPFNPLN